MNSEKLIIFDTTLRDGEQCPGASLNIKEKLEIARQLSLLKVDVIEAGFPAASPGDFESVRQIANEVRGASVAGLARALEKDIEANVRALEKAESPRIHIFLSTSKSHRVHMVKKAKEEIIEMGVKAIRFAKKYCDDIEFSPMDATRTERDFLVDVLTATIDAGATTVNIPDTVGYTIPEWSKNFKVALRIFESPSRIAAIKRHANKVFTRLAHQLNQLMRLHVASVIFDSDLDSVIKGLLPNGL